jgi:CRP/FNR family cyclic AMP-dependent transcriptional regulator
VDVVELLRASELFGEFSGEVLEVLAKQAVTKRYDRNDRVFEEGEQPDALYVVRGGRIAIAKRSPDGKESVVALMESGDLFGDMGLFDGLPRSAEARALEPSELIVVAFPPVRQMFTDRPELLFDVVAFLSRRIRATDVALADSVFLDVTGRTAKRLLELAGGSDEFTMPLTQEELASMVGASRERVNKSIAQFVRLGWITQSDRRYRITDRPQLEFRSR